MQNKKALLKIIGVHPAGWRRNVFERVLNVENNMVYKQKKDKLEKKHKP